MNNFLTSLSYVFLLFLLAVLAPWSFLSLLVALASWRVFNDTRNELVEIISFVIGIISIFGMIAGLFHSLESIIEYGQIPLKSLIDSAIAYFSTL